MQGIGPPENLTIFLLIVLNVLIGFTCNIHVNSIMLLCYREFKHFGYTVKHAYNKVRGTGIF